MRARKTHYTRTFYSVIMPQRILARILSVIMPQRIARVHFICHYAQRIARVHFIGHYVAAHCMLASREKISRVSSAFYPSFRFIGSPAHIKKEPVRAPKICVRKCGYATAVTHPRSV